MYAAAEQTARANSPAGKVTFPNLRSRILLKGFFERQSAIPEPPPWLVEKSLQLVEKLLRVEIRDIRVDRPIFLLGLPRSGTTMLQDLCCAHPDLAYFTNAMHQVPRSFCAVETLRKQFNLDA